MTTLCNAIIAGRPPCPTFLTPARLIPLSKGEGKVRPLAVGECFVRLASRLLLAHFPLADLLSPMQFGVGSSGATEPIIHGINSTQSAYDELVAVDMSNAFNTVSRTAIAAFLAEHLREALPLFTLLYQQPTQLFTTSPTGITALLSSSGTRQGDPLGSFLFSGGIRTTLERFAALHPAAKVWAYLDDIFIQVPASLSATALTDSLASLMANIGLQVNHSKTRRITTPQLRESGMDVLGGHIGSPASTDTFLSGQVQQASSTLSHLSSLPLQPALALLRVSALPRVAHLARLFPSATSAPHLRVWDTRIMDTLSSLLRSPLPTLSRTIASLPIRLGGCGLIPIAPTAPFAAAASALTAMLCLTNRALQLTYLDLHEFHADITHTAQVHSPDAVLQDWLADITPTSASKLQSSLSHSFHASRLASLLPTLSPAQQTQLSLNTSPLFRLVPHILPTNPLLTISSHSLAHHYHQRLLLLPPPPPSPCPCGTTPTSPLHPLSCPQLAPLRSERHTALKATLAHFISSCNAHPRIETRLPDGGFMDITFTHNTHSYHTDVSVCIDHTLTAPTPSPTITSPSSMQALLKSMLATTTDAPIHNRSHKKHSRYPSSSSLSSTLIVFTISTGGGLSPDAKHILRLLSPSLAYQKFFLASLSCLLLSWNYRMFAYYCSLRRTALHSLTVPL
jgi:hypothetical protein